MGGSVGEKDRKGPRVNQCVKWAERKRLKGRKWVMERHSSRNVVRVRTRVSKMDELF